MMDEYDANEYVMAEGYYESLAYFKTALKRHNTGMCHWRSGSHDGKNIKFYLKCYLNYLNHLDDETQDTKKHNIAWCNELIAYFSNDLDINRQDDTFLEALRYVEYAEMIALTTFKLISPEYKYYKEKENTMNWEQCIKNVSENDYKAVLISEEVYLQSIDSAVSFLNTYNYLLFKDSSNSIIIKNYLKQFIDKNLTNKRLNGWCNEFLAIFDENRAKTDHLITTLERMKTVLESNIDVDTIEPEYVYRVPPIGEPEPLPDMAISIEQVSVTAKARALKAEYTIEFAQPLIHEYDDMPYCEVSSLYGPR